MELGNFREGAHHAWLIRSRLVWGVAVVLVLALVLVGRSAYLQLAGHEHYSQLAHDNRVRLVPIPPTRGLIYDRDGEILAENIPAHRLVITPEQVPDLDATLERLDAIVELRPTDLEQFHDQRKRQRRFQSIPLKHQLSDKEVARFAINRHRFPGVELEAELVRHYPHNALGAHAIGYVGRINKNELQRVDPDEYQGSSHIGKSGIEGYYEDRLHGQVGVERVETTASGRVLRTLERDPPTPGQDLKLTLDIDLQRAGKEALGDRSGAVVALDPDTGDVLALVSKPSFDPNLFVTGIGLDQYRELQTKQEQPLYNRVLNGQYPPASTVKPFVALAGLTEDTREPDDTVECTGRYRLPNVSHVWRGWKQWGHGEINMKQAVAQSCDIYFYDLAYDLGIDAMHESLAPFGFGAATGIDLNGERTGVLPSREWKRRNKGEPWYHGETLITGIGQGFSLATPLQLAHATATMATRGEAEVPQLLAEAVPPGSGEPYRPDPEAPERSQALSEHSAEHWQLAHDSMIEVVHGERGTARGIGRDLDYRMAGKTGTAQVFGLGADEEYDADELPRRLHDHGLFVAFAPAPDPEIAVAVVVEHGGGGSSAAAPVARAVLDAWLGGEAG
jgi:penicillin-binding protein 2